MDTWITVLERGLLPVLGKEGLRKMADGLRNHRDRILRGTTVEPPTLLRCMDLPAERYCPIGYVCHTPGATVRNINDRYWKVAQLVRKKTGDPSALGYFVGPWDDESISDEALLAELDRLTAPEFAAAS